jgi:hypothetical protein
MPGRLAQRDPAIAVEHDHKIRVLAELPSVAMADNGERLWMHAVDTERREVYKVEEELVSSAVAIVALETVRTHLLRAHEVLGIEAILARKGLERKLRAAPPVVDVRLDPYRRRQQLRGAEPGARERDSSVAWDRVQLYHAAAAGTNSAAVADGETNVCRDRCETFQRAAARQRLETGGVEAYLGWPLAVALSVARADGEQLVEDLAGFGEFAGDVADRYTRCGCRDSDEPIEAARARQVDPAFCQSKAAMLGVLGRDGVAAARGAGKQCADQGVKSVVGAHASRCAAVMANAGPSSARRAAAIRSRRARAGSPAPLYESSRALAQTVGSQQRSAASG